MKNYLYLILILITACKPSVQKEDSFQTICNPMELSYRFRPETNEISRREAADPTIIKFKGEYWLFASKSGGYWFSHDLIEWSFVLRNEIPTEGYAPTVIAIGDTLYMAVSSKQNDKVYQTSDPKSGHWSSSKTLTHAVEDPCFYQDDDGRLYLYWGCSNQKPLFGAEIDPISFKNISESHDLIYQNPERYGWEVRGDYNTEYDNPPWLEGLWMTKHKGKYYLQYSAPGTLEKSYSDGVYVSTNPLGPFELASHNPFAYKPEGFACGAGHGSTIEDDHGNFWHLGTISISVKHKFERRIGFYPAQFDEDGTMFSYTRFGDYPMIIPDNKMDSRDLFAGWMLLSYKKKVKTSSEIAGFPSFNMVDENIRTYWAARSGQNEWAIVDLEEVCNVHAIQINFAEHETKLYDRISNLKHRYMVSVSNDGENWETLIDKSENNDDCSHDYTQLKEMVKARFVKIENLEIPDGKFAMSGLRVFGLGVKKLPEKVNGLEVKRDLSDKRCVHLTWDHQKNAMGYNIRYGMAPDKLLHNYMVYDESSLTIRSLNSDQDYYFSIEAFNEGGVGKMSPVVPTK